VSNLSDVAGTAPQGTQGSQGDVGTLGSQGSQGYPGADGTGGRTFSNIAIDSNLAVDTDYFDTGGGDNVHRLPLLSGVTEGEYIEFDVEDGGFKKEIFEHASDSNAEIGTYYLRGDGARFTKVGSAWKVTDETVSVYGAAAVTADGYTTTIDVNYNTFYKADGYAVSEDTADVWDYTSSTTGHCVIAPFDAVVTLFHMCDTYYGYDHINWFRINGLDTRDSDGGPGGDPSTKSTEGADMWVGPVVKNDTLIAMHLLPDTKDYIGEGQGTSPHIPSTQFQWLFNKRIR
jgi:hypothetical protein